MTTSATTTTSNNTDNSPALGEKHKLAQQSEGGSRSDAIAEQSQPKRARVEEKKESLIVGETLEQLQARLSR